MEEQEKQSGYAAPDENQEDSMITVTNPAWLLTPPDGQFPAAPINTRLQTLPFSELSWPNFERLVRRLVEREGKITDCWIYGTPGQAQHGLDILALLEPEENNFACYQCKCVIDFSPDEIRKAVDKFLAGKFADSTTLFVICTTASLSRTEQVDAIAAQTKRLHGHQIAFEVWDGSEGGQLAQKLKRYPDLVDDFFLREWVSRFNGIEAAQALGERLDGCDLHRLRSQLAEIYAALFQRYDPGLRLGHAQRPASLLRRYIAPAVIESRTLASREGNTELKQVVLDDPSSSVFADKAADSSNAERTRGIRRVASVTQELRVQLDDWFSRNGRSVVLGEPGYGKSTLLRVMALQMLTATSGIAPGRWCRLLPVWVSFGGFSTAIQKQPSLSLEDYFHNWLHQNTADDIRPLFGRAIRQGELLLMVDGLDEGQDTDAAKMAMDRISAFLATRELPAVFTSRPRGYERIRPDVTWPVVRLAAFDEMQISRFAQMWFEYLEPAGNRNEETRLRTENFIKATRANARIIELARTPLFCQLLIDIFRYTHHLPEQRIRVYEKIIDLLLNDHPEARLQAAGLQSKHVVRKEDMREMLMRLALHIQESGGAGVISATACQSAFCQFLTDDVYGPGHTPYEARHQARAVTDYALTGLGLMVERSPDELGFFHLTLQEYLAAQSMIREEEEDQLTWLARVWGLPKWREVVLAWFSIRGADQGKLATQRAIEHLKTIAETPLLCLQLLILRTEIAVHDMGLSPREARLTIQEAADTVTTTPFKALRLQLASLLAQGVSSAAVGNQCENFIMGWLPGYTASSRSAVMKAMGTWKPEEDLLHALTRALHDESLQCQLVAAETLAKTFNNDSSVGNFLAARARSWPEVTVRAVSLYALTMGWPAHPELNELAASALLSESETLMCMGILTRVGLGEGNEQDRDRLWEMLIGESLSYELYSTCDTLLRRGWGQDRTLLERALAMVREKNDGASFNRERVFIYLARVWPGDEYVAQEISAYLQTRFLSLRHSRALGAAILEGFSGHPTVCSALKAARETLVSKHPAVNLRQDSQFVSLIIGGEDEKRALIDAYRYDSHDTHPQREPFWIIEALMEGWSSDRDVITLLTAEFRKAPEDVYFLAPWASRFIQDRADRRQWLLSALRAADVWSVGLVVSHLLREFTDAECIRAAKSALDRDIWAGTKVAIQNQLIEMLPDDPDVISWVAAAFKDAEGELLASIARSFETASDVRARLLQVIQPGRAEVRAEVYRVLREYPVAPEAASRLTSQVFAESHAQVRTAGFLARCQALRSDEQAFAYFLTEVRAEMKATGMIYETRRRSAFTALLFSDQYEECATLLASGVLQGLDWLNDYENTDTLTSQMMSERWEALSPKISEAGLDLNAFWGILVQHNHAMEMFRNPAARLQLEAHLQGTPQTPFSNLELMARVFPGSPELRAELMRIMMDPSGHVDVTAEAQRIYAEQFGGDGEALAALEQAWHTADLGNDTDFRLRMRLLYALLLGWPDSAYAQELLRMPQRPRLPLYIVLTMCSIRSNDEDALGCIEAIHDAIRQTGFMLPDPYQDALRRWAVSPLSDAVLDDLRQRKDGTSQLTAMTLRCLAGPPEEQYLTDMSDVFNQSMSGERAILDGIDLFTGSVMTLPQALASQFLRVNT